MPSFSRFADGTQGFIHVKDSEPSGAIDSDIWVDSDHANREIKVKKNDEFLTIGVDEGTVIALG